MAKKLYIISIGIIISFLLAFFSISFCKNVAGKDGEQSPCVLKDKSIISRIEKECESLETVDEIADFSLRLTAELLYFKMKPEIHSPNELEIGKTKGTHCVGYSCVCASICNYALKYKRLPAKCKHLRGDVKWFGLNMTALISDIFNQMGQKRLARFCQDHDFVLIENYGTKESISLDPSFYDLFGVDLKTKKKIDFKYEDKQ